MFSNIKFEYGIIALLTIGILFPVIMILSCHKVQNDDEADLLKYKNELLNEDGDKFIRKVSSTVKWRVILVASIAMAFFTTTLMIVILYLLYQKMETLKLVILVQLFFLSSLLISYLSIFQVLNYYDYHFLTVQPSN